MGSYVENRKILYVDDEAGLLSAFTSLMRRKKYETTILQDSTQIERTLSENGPFAIVFSDQRMPGLDGVGVLETVTRMHPATRRVLVTGYADQQETARAVNVGGIVRYIAKPWNDEELLKLADDLLGVYNLAEENKQLSGELRKANEHLTEILEGTVAGTVRLLGDMIGAVNEEAAARSVRIRALGHGIVAMLEEISAEERWQILRALDLCFLGVAVLPSWIQVTLNKQGLSSLDRFPAVKDIHAVAGNLLCDIPRFQEVARIITLQGKNFDGSGEPVAEKVKGTDIPLGARLLHILVDLERMSSPHFKTHELLASMKSQSKHYDTALVERVRAWIQPKKLDAVELSLGLKELKAGMIVLDDVKSLSNQVLLRAGATLTDTAIGILRHWHRGDPLMTPLRVNVPAHP